MMEQGSRHLTGWSKGLTPLGQAPRKLCCNTGQCLCFASVVSPSDITHHQRDTPVPADFLSNRSSAKGNRVCLSGNLKKKKVEVNSLETAVE